ncbi:peptide-methionine (S)-S-oxide reductase MsrA [Comamonas badia]|jgi:peptide-methionine (S)-S-oxide reductase|uniref:peptide-methionine (S)-S-oxide reductase MsrA n=1 Tax=Comamonas badia TaxID=265291 RepID=UPI0003FBD46D|nr:peptide-methionine (S)-S-oxide reductase MsrA [Comamonas badia]
MNTQETITLAGGCFWCTEAVFEEVRGVTRLTSGYANGQVRHAPSYEEVCSGTTGCAEVIQLQFDPAQISLRQVLEIFFATHDPTQLNRQGNDVGTQYRSGVYYGDPAQGELARALVQELAAEGGFGAPIVTEIEPLAQFWPAEGYHQRYYSSHPQQGYCAYVISPKVQKLRKTFAQHLKA